MLAKIKVLVAKVPTVCAVLDCQGGDSGQIAARGEGGEVKYLSGSCSPSKNRKLVFRFRVYLSSSFLLQERWAKQQGRGASPGEREGIKAGCYDSTASMPLRSFGEAIYHRCSFARKMRRCRCRWCFLISSHSSVGPLLFQQLW